MTDPTARIEQFRTMAEANPKDELAFFSLGRAYADAARHGEAAAAFEQVIALSPKMSKAYQLLAAAQVQQGKQLDAIETLKRGARVAHERGDFVPRNDMVKQLKEFGVEMPDLAAAAEPARAPTEGEVHCKRCGLVKPRMARQPFSHATGKLIQDNTCADCWREWIGMGTKVINELRLPLSDPQAQKVFDQHMMEFLNLK
ncbi:MAG TPA: Fe(2+)-trafficking protein [Tepidisphaeraceae bacterium]|jgi:Fe-S cluster biosynthesis and repair protein YggX